MGSVDADVTLSVGDVMLIVCEVSSTRSAMVVADGKDELTRGEVAVTVGVVSVAGWGAMVVDNEAVSSGVEVVVGNGEDVPTVDENIVAVVVCLIDSKVLVSGDEFTETDWRVVLDGVVMVIDGEIALSADEAVVSKCGVALTVGDVNITNVKREFACSVVEVEVDGDEIFRLIS